jgi:hypothetical protein
LRCSSSTLITSLCPAKNGSGTPHKDILALPLLALFTQVRRRIVLRNPDVR